MVDHTSSNAITVRIQSAILRHKAADDYQNQQVKQTAVELRLSEMMTLHLSGNR